MNMHPATAEHVDRLAPMISEGWAASFTYSESEFLCAGVATREGFEPVKASLALRPGETESDAVYRCIRLLEKRTLMEEQAVSAELGKAIEAQYASQPDLILKTYYDMMGFVPEHVKEMMNPRR